MSKGFSGLFEGTSGSYWGVSAGSSSTNKFSDKTIWPSSSKEWVDFGKIIGIWIDESMNENPVTKGVIHHSKKGNSYNSCKS